MTPCVAVVGAGLMGNGIAQLMAASGQKVAVFEPFDAVRQHAAGSIEEISRTIGGDTECLREIALYDDLAMAVEGADFVIEAIPEKVELKQQMFRNLAELTIDSTILCTNSSVIPVTKVAEQLADHLAARVVGMHFWNPPHLIPLVEVIQGNRTSATTVTAAMGLLRREGKEPVHVEKDLVVGNRLQHALWREAISLVAEGAIDATGIDTVVMKSFGLRLSVLGPMMNADLVGLELTQDVHREVFPHLCNDELPNPVLQKMLDNGHTGMRGGKGFYDWTPETSAQVHADLARHLLEVTSDES